MKILIVAIPRTGSSNLLYSLADKHKLKPLFEPFDNTGRVSYIEGEDNVVLKTMIFQNDNLQKLSKQFDSTILLSRKNLVECAESYAYFIKNRSGNFKSYYSYIYENVSKEEFSTAYKLIVGFDLELRRLSETLNIPITFYEDIYDISSEHRLRKNTKSKFI